MNRRGAIWGIGLLAGSALALGGTTWFARYKTPDLAYLTAHQPLLAALAETILPATDTPGAIAAGVPAFILKTILENATTIAQNRFIDGLKAVEAYCQDTTGRSYVACSHQQQETVLRYFEAAAKPRAGLPGKVEKKLAGEPFFTLLKNYTCLGYYTSLAGATQALAYAAIPGRYAGCVPLATGQKTWATK